MNVLVRNRFIRSAVYLYFAAGMALLLGASAASIVRFAPQEQKGFALVFLLVVAAGIFGMLALASWDDYARPLNVRKWTILCALASLGFVNVVLMTRIYAGGAG